jgi:hypothetical protein
MSIEQWRNDDLKGKTEQELGGKFAPVPLRPLRISHEIIHVQIKVPATRRQLLTV